MALVLLNRTAILSRSVSVAGMTFVDFMRFNEINLDEFTINAFFHNIRRDMPIYMTENIISNFGYGGDIKTQKHTITDLLRSNFSEYENKLWWSRKNKEYGELLANEIKTLDAVHIIQYPSMSTGKGSGILTHILVMPIVFKEMLMLCQTEQGKIIRRNYILLVDAIAIYAMYQCECKNISYEKEIESYKNHPAIRQHNRLQKIKEIDTQIYQKNRVGVVYFICEDDRRDVVKIGYTYNLRERLNQLQCANSRKLIVLKYYLTQYPQIEEKNLHNLYREKHIRGEWFNIGVEQIQTNTLTTYMVYQSMLVVRQKDEKIDELLALVKEEQIKSTELIALAKEERAKADEERAKSDEERRLAEERFIKITGDARDIQDALDETRTEVIASSETIKNMAKNCVVPNSVPKGKLEVFAVFQNVKTQQFRVACVQWANYNRTLVDYKKECAADGIRVCLKINYNANAVMFWNSFYKKFESEYMVNRNGRKFHLALNKTVEDLRNEIIGHCDEQMIASME